jgi:hypothetical protein
MCPRFGEFGCLAAKLRTHFAGELGRDISGAIAVLDVDKADIVGRILMRQAKERMRRRSPRDGLIGEMQCVGAGQPAIVVENAGECVRTEAEPRIRQRQVDLDMRAAEIDCGRGAESADETEGGVITTSPPALRTTPIRGSTPAESAARRVHVSARSKR